MKFLISQAIILITAVTFLYYLLNNQNFLPTNELGNYDWVNIITLITIVIFSIFSFLNLFIYAILKVSRKIDSIREIILFCLKYSSIITVGIFLVFTLNFFHLLNWIWGGSILLVVLIFLFII